MAQQFVSDAKEEGARGESRRKIEKLKAEPTDANLVEAHQERESFKKRWGNRPSVKAGGAPASGVDEYAAPWLSKKEVRESNSRPKSRKASRKGAR